MIGKLTGTHAGTMRDGSLIVDVRGVGYVVRVPQTAAAQLVGAAASIELFVHTAVREDAIDLYGFPTEEELSFFKLLTGVSGVGPKTALGILNVADVGSLRRAVASGDADALAKVYGIGKKSAERIVVELRDKLAREEAAQGGMVAAARTVDGEVIEALQALGYSAPEARGAVRSLAPEENQNIKKRLAEALRQLGRAAR